MKVIEQLVQHFHARGVLTEQEIEYLIRHGFIGRHDLALASANDVAEEPLDPIPEPSDELHRLGEEMSGVSAGRRGGKKGDPAKPKPTDHGPTALGSVLAAHLADREQYRALVELGGRLNAGADWPTAAAAIADAKPDDLETALVTTLNRRPPALGELWHWCHVEGLYSWAESEHHAGAVALRRLLRAEAPTECALPGRLATVPGVDGFRELLRARKALLESLRGLYERHFGRLRVWLVNPGGSAAEVWPALPWAFVLLYNFGTQAEHRRGKPVSFDSLSEPLRPVCWEAVWRMDSARVLRTLRSSPRLNTAVDGWRDVDGWDFSCPTEWTGRGLKLRY